MTPRWLTKRQVLAIHAEQLALYGGGAGLRDEGLLESALARPQHLAHYQQPALFDLAASYAFGLIRNHPFVDGNKRTGFLAAYTFLGLNGYALTAPAAEAAVVFLAVADGSLPEEGLAAWLADHTVAAIRR